MPERGVDPALIRYERGVPARVTVTLAESGVQATLEGGGAEIAFSLEDLYWLCAVAGPAVLAAARRPAPAEDSPA